MIQFPWSSSGTAPTALLTIAQMVEIDRSRFARPKCSLRGGAEVADPAKHIAGHAPTADGVDDVRFLVALPPVRDLLLSAKYLSFAATVRAWLPRPGAKDE